MVGQEHITKTLKNQIIAGRVGHAYLLNGGRGTGKTSAAKILARAINCLKPKDGEPCNECEICKAALARVTNRHRRNGRSLQQQCRRHSLYS